MEKKRPNLLGSDCLPLIANHFSKLWQKVVVVEELFKPSMIFFFFLFYMGILNATCLTFGLKLEDFNGRDHFLAFYVFVVHVLGLISGMIELQMYLKKSSTKP